MSRLPSKPGKQWTDKQERRPTPTQGSKFALSEYADEWRFFNHGALFTYGGLKHDPVADWYAQQEIGTEILRLPFRRAVFKGLDAATDIPGMSWDHIVCGVRSEFWESLFGFLGGVAAVDHQRKRYVQTFSGEIEILDPVLVERHSAFDPSVPKITITVFCVDATDGRWEVRPPINAAASPTFIKVDPRPEVVQMGRAVLSGDIQHLQHKDNPAFQPLLDKFQRIVLPGEPDAGSSGATSSS